jgi:ADP-ribose pyrophosphatase YjhB (NUDIX family)
MPDKAPLPAVSIALVDGERLLLVRRGRAPAQGQFAFPGGRVESGESLEQAVRRELLEETGLTAGEVCPLQTLRVAREGDGPDFELHVFRGRPTPGTPVAGDDADHAGWYTLRDMAELPVIPSVLAVARALLAPGAT